MIEISEEMFNESEFKEKHPKLAPVFHDFYREGWYDLILYILGKERINLEDVDPFCRKIEELSEEQIYICLAFAQEEIYENNGSFQSEEDRSKLIDKVRNGDYDVCRIENIDDLLNDLSRDMYNRTSPFLAPLGFHELQVDEKTKWNLIPYLHYDKLGEALAFKYRWLFVKNGLYVKDKTTEQSVVWP